MNLTGLSSAAAVKWYVEGNKFCEARNYSEAIECYDNSLKLIKFTPDAIVLLIRRSDARNSLQNWDAALADAQAVLSLSVDDEKGMYQACRALYGLRRFEECHALMRRFVSLYPTNRDVNIQLCEQRLNEQKGHYDFGAMLDEAVEKSPKPDMDRGDYIGPVEIRPCVIKSHGRGLFTKKAVKAGELLAVEKAFSAAFPDKEDIQAPLNPETGLRSSKDLSKLHAELATSTFIKLHRNKSLVPAFTDLYAGFAGGLKMEKDIALPFVDDAFVQLRILYNSYAFAVLSKDFNWRGAASTKYHAVDSAAAFGAIGTWLLASSLNHSCYPNVRRAFIGDVMILRATQDVHANTELKIGYLSSQQDLPDREVSLDRYGFKCMCRMCVSERDTPPANLERRDQIMKEIITLFQNPTPTIIEEYYAHLSALESTYVHPAYLEPRRTAIHPILNLQNACQQDGRHDEVVKLGLLLLECLAFKVSIRPATFAITIWGLLTDEVIIALATMWTAYSNVQPAISDDVGEALKLAYTIMAGEDASFEMAWGKARPTVFDSRDGSGKRKALTGYDGVDEREREVGNDKPFPKTPRWEDRLADLQSVGKELLNHDDIGKREKQPKEGVNESGFKRNEIIHDVKKGKQRAWVDEEGTLWKENIVDRVKMKTRMTTSGRLPRETDLARLQRSESEVRLADVDGVEKRGMDAEDVDQENEDEKHGDEEGESGEDAGDEDFDNGDMDADEVHNEDMDNESTHEEDTDPKPLSNHLSHSSSHTKHPPRRTAYIQNILNGPSTATFDNVSTPAHPQRKRYHEARPKGRYRFVPGGPELIE